jgi:hypothetical protein
MIGRPLGGGKAVVMSVGPINELVDALRNQSKHNRRGAIAASLAAAALSLQTLLELMWSA